MSKKDKQQIVNHIQNLNLEIDYDKLAEAIVKAENKAKDSQADELAKSGDTPQKERGIRKTRWRNFCNRFKVLWYILRNKENGSDLMGDFFSHIMNSIALDSIVGSIIFFAEAIWLITSDASLITSGAIMFAIGSITALNALICRACANDMNRETYKDYILPVFSGFVGLSALVLAVIALFK